MDTLQQSLDKAISELPALFLEKSISRKLEQQGITGTKALSSKLTKHILSRSSEPFRYNSYKNAEDIRLLFTHSDADRISCEIDLFCEKKLSQLLLDVAGRLSKTILKDLKLRWAKEHALQNADLSGFRERLEGRWGEPLDQLRMLLTMAREWGQWVHARQNSSKTDDKTILRDILMRLHVRACQVTDEIICLLENGFADGAMARWRTLHEIGVVAAVISRHGEGIAKRYLAHQAIESKRALNKYLNCCGPLGYKPPSARAVKKITEAYEAAVMQYGIEFDADFGWATHHLKKNRVTFANLEAEAGRADMRSHYQMGNDNVHAGVKSMFFRLGLLNNYNGLLAGRSNVGLTEPGQNAAYTLMQISVLVGLSEPNLDDFVAANMMGMLRAEIPSTFYRADKQLRKDDREYRDS